MLRFFRINDPYRLVFVFLILVLIRFGQSFFMNEISYFELKWLLLGEWLSEGFTMYGEAFDYTGPLAAMVYKYLDVLFGRSLFAHHTISSFIIIIQAGIFNQLLLKNKAYDENSYLPAFLYVILMIAVPDFMALSPHLLSLTFVLLALRNVLRRIDNQATDELFLNSGLFTGIATMLFLPSIVFFLVFLVSLILFSTAVARRLLLYCFGFLLVFAMCTLYFYWTGSYNLFIGSFLIKGFLLPASELINLNGYLILSGPFILIFLLSVAKTWSSARLTNFQQKIQQVIWLMFLGGFSTLFLSNEKVGHELVFSVPVIAYFWTHYFVLLKRRLFRAIMPGLMIFGLIGFSVFTYTDLVRDITVADSERKAQNGTMILGERLGAYKESEMLSPCFNQVLCEDAFDRIDYYESAVRVYEIIRKSDPDKIIDETGIAPSLFQRFPNLAVQYRKSGNNTYLKISN